MSNIRVTQVVLRPSLASVRPWWRCLWTRSQMLRSHCWLSHNLHPGIALSGRILGPELLYVHGMDVPDRDAFVHYVKDGLERRVIELMR